MLHAWDLQGTNFSNGPMVDNAIEVRERSKEHCHSVGSSVSEMNGVKESAHAIKANGLHLKGTKSTSEHMQTLKIPEAVVAFAQAAAKAYGEPEKYLPGWPLLSPPKVQVQKCEKCSREFCSPINYRRHIRVHRRSLNIDKDSPKNREFLGAFWDKLSMDEAREIVSLKSAAQEEAAGSSIIRELTSFIRKPGFSSLPQVYVKAGAALLDIVQFRPSRFPISSRELFGILDDASERTFLLAGTALSLQKYVFGGEVEKIGLEMKNLVACTSFLLEQKLVKAWLADKDAEALRCQKLLVEEEEAAQKRQAELLEKKRLKKLRQKEPKVKDGDKVDFKDSSPDSMEARSSSAAVSCTEKCLDSNPDLLELLMEPVQMFPEPVQSLDADLEGDVGCCLGPGDANTAMVYGNTDSANGHNGECRARVHMGNSQRQFPRWQVLKPARNVPNGFHSGQVPLLKSAVTQKHNSYRDQQKAAPLVNGHKVWTRKTKLEGEGEVSNSHGRAPRDSMGQSEQNGNEVLIGSICVTLRGSEDCCHHDILAASCGSCAADDQPLRHDNVQEKPAKPDLGQNGLNRQMVKLWRPVSRHEVGRGSAMVQNSKREVEPSGVSGKAEERILLEDNCPAHGIIDDSSSSRSEDSTTAAEGGDLMGRSLFSSSAVEAFLAQRWKEAIAANHVMLVLSPEAISQNCSDVLPDGPCMEEVSPSDSRSILGSAENRLAGVGPSNSGVSQKPKFRPKTEKGRRVQYIPKQRNNA